MRGWLRLIKKARISRRPTSYKWQTFFVCGVVCHKSTLCKKNLQQFSLFFVNFLDVFFKLCQTPNTLEFCTVCIPRNQVQHGTERVYNINIESPKLSPDVPLFHVQFLFALRQHWTSHTFSIQGPLFSIYTYIYTYTYIVYTHTHIYIYIYIHILGGLFHAMSSIFQSTPQHLGVEFAKQWTKVAKLQKKEPWPIFGGWMMDLFLGDGWWISCSCWSQKKWTHPKLPHENRHNSFDPDLQDEHGSVVDLGLRALRCRCAVCNPFCPSSAAEMGLAG